MTTGQSHRKSSQSRATQLALTGVLALGVAFGGLGVPLVPTAHASVEFSGNGPTSGPPPGGGALRSGSTLGASPASPAANSGSGAVGAANQGVRGGANASGASPAANTMSLPGTLGNLGPTGPSPVGPFGGSSSGASSASSSFSGSITATANSGGASPANSAPNNGGSVFSDITRVVGQASASASPASTSSNSGGSLLDTAREAAERAAGQVSASASPASTSSSSLRDSLSQDKSSASSTSLSSLVRPPQGQGSGTPPQGQGSGTPPQGQGGGTPPQPMPPSTNGGIQCVVAPCELPRIPQHSGTVQINIQHYTPFWVHVPVVYHHYFGPFHTYDVDWYFWRHVSFPDLYVAFAFEPVLECGSYYYFFPGDGLFYCRIV